MTFMDIMEKRGSLQSRRQQQTLDWVWQMTEEQLRSEILNNPAVIARTAEVPGGDRPQSSFRHPGGPGASGHHSGGGAQIVSRALPQTATGG